MAEDLQPWVGFADSLRFARVERELRLVDIGGFSAAHLSRVERNLNVPTRAIAARYEQATGVAGLVDTYQQIAANLNQRQPVRAGSGEEYFETGYVVEEFDTTIRVADTTRVVERRAIRALIPGLGGIRVRQGLFEWNGAVPALLSIGALNARLASVDWISEHYFAMNLEFPEELAPGALFEYTVEYEFEFLFPRYTFQPLVQARRFSLLLQLPDDTAKVYEVRGVPMMVIDDLKTDIGSTPVVGVTKKGLNRFNTLRCEYDGLVPGLLYGMIWE